MDIFKKLTKLEHEAEAFGFKWQYADQIMQQIHSECAEINVHLNENPSLNPLLQEEIGDLLHAVFSLCLFCKFDPEVTLANSVTKFSRRFTLVKELAAANGLSSLEGQSFAALMKLWDQAKKIDN